MMIYLILFFVLIVVYVIYLYNRLISSRQNVTEAWSDIDVQLKRRHDLIPNLINLVKGYATYEKNLFEQISALRTKALSLNTNDITRKSAVETDIEKSLKSLIAVAESYPDLKASKTYLELQEALTKTEDQIASARRIYNSNAADYNTLVLSFPTNLLARLFGFIPSSYFQSEE